MLDPTIQALLIAAGLGLLVGLERESDGPHATGVRTFAVLTMLGAVAGSVAADGAWAWTLLALGWVCLAILLGVAYASNGREDEGARGLTTEFAVLAMYAAGFLVGQGRTLPALVLSGILLVLLRSKKRMHSLVDRLAASDLNAVAKLALIGLVVLPVLPDKAYDPYGVLNPREIWFIVVLISGISIAAYLVRRMLGERVGTVLGGLLGGAISSTASTVSYARASRSEAISPPAAALGILLASTVVNLRVLLEVAIAGRALLSSLALPLAILTVVMAAACWLAWRACAEDTAEGASEIDNPAQLGAAITFGLLYAGVLLAVAVVRERFGGEALYIVAGVSGLTDVDAITLSAARLVSAGRVEAGTAWRVVLIAITSNLLFKLAAAGVLGGRILLRRLVIPFAVAMGTAALLLVLWPW